MGVLPLFLGRKTLQLLGNIQKFYTILLSDGCLMVAKEQHNHFSVYGTEIVGNLLHHQVSISQTSDNAFKALLVIGGHIGNFSSCLIFFGVLSRKVGNMVLHGDHM